jgi:small GTP-binding protein
MTGRPK